MMNFHGLTYDEALPKTNKHIRFVSHSDEYNQELYRLLFPNLVKNTSGYTIPRIIPPYRLHQQSKQNELKRMIALGKVGERTSYAQDLDLENIPVDIHSHSLFRFEKAAWHLEEQQGFDFAVMCGNFEDITFIICAVKPRPSGRGYKAQSVKEGFVAVEYIV